LASYTCPNPNLHPNPNPNPNLKSNPNPNPNPSSISVGALQQTQLGKRLGEIRFSEMQLSEMPLGEMLRHRRRGLKFTTEYQMAQNCRNQKYHLERVTLETQNFQCILITA